MNIAYASQQLFIPMSAMQPRGRQNASTLLALLKGRVIVAKLKGVTLTFVQLVLNSSSLCNVDVSLKYYEKSMISFSTFQIYWFQIQIEIKSFG
mmetsp:Transcript_58757/g.155450  ORF Transcript_58757/g.155450 Transcript_58757/m.155450 type:complete len:94 (-) Transcript_58757:4-285(-)